NLGLWAGEGAEHDSEPVIAFDLVALVEYHGTDSSCCRGVVDLDPEVAASPLEECDVPLGESGEVFCLASAGGGSVAFEVDVDRHDRAAHVSDTRVRHDGVVSLVDVGGRCRRHLLEGRRVQHELVVTERLTFGLVPDALQLLLDVFGGCDVAGSSCGTVSV